MALLAASGYALASLFHKRAYQRGATSEQAFHWANFIGLACLGWTVLLGTGMAWQELWRPAVISAMIYVGSLATFAAIRAGDVSLVTPLMGTKVVFVALATPWLTGKHLDWKVWLACGLTGLGILLSGRHELSKGNASLRAIGLCLISCLFFGVSDVFIQAWAPQLGGFTFLGLIPIFLAIFSVIHIRALSPGKSLWPTSRPAFWDLIWGGLILAAQGITMAIALGFFADAARVNVAYGSRGLWSLLLIWALARWFGNEETADKRAFAWRVAGCLLVTAAIFLAVT